MRGENGGVEGDLGTSVLFHELRHLSVVMRGSNRNVVQQRLSSINQDNNLFPYLVDEHPLLFEMMTLKSLLLFLNMCRC